MSVDLTLYVCDPVDFGIGFFFGRATIRVPQDYQVFGQIRDMSDWRAERPEIPERPTIEVRRIPSHMKLDVYREGGLRRVKRDEVGPLTYLEAGELKRQLTLPKDCNRQMRALKAYIDLLPPETPIILYWD